MSSVAMIIALAVAAQAYDEGFTDKLVDGSVDTLISKQVSEKLAAVREKAKKNYEKATAEEALRYTPWPGIDPQRPNIYLNTWKFYVKYFFTVALQYAMIGTLWRKLLIDPSKRFTPPGGIVTPKDLGFEEGEEGDEQFEKMAWDEPEGGFQDEEGGFSLAAKNSANVIGSPEMVLISLVMVWGVALVLLYFRRHAYTGRKEPLLAIR